MREQDFIPKRRKVPERLLFVSAKLRATAAAGASAAAIAMFAFVLAIIPPVPETNALTLAVEGPNAASGVEA